MIGFTSQSVRLGGANETGTGIRRGGLVSAAAVRRHDPPAHPVVSLWPRWVHAARWCVKARA
ncbi:hypothetical protein MES5069_480010 [Mesorhizobium escarrei]|uniref:Uncharacterized protein n=1 Tax=Mesorhizobium escarrei TaxID=666018 RepID=A0ABM9E8Y1_9HYPH|nr:hypothetical protein MES5069_480010 [Mesorhizobium escarrei]